MEPEEVIVHHSLTTDSGTVSWGAIRKYHIETNGWSDIGYHAGIELIDNSGVQYYEALIGRMWDVSGAHCIGHNNRSLGICFVGNFDEAQVPQDQLIVGAKLIAYWLKKFHISIEDVYPHSAFADKSCPGDLFSMSKLLEAVDRLA
jgi:N-acetylmuramoyl-L-alanine amidase